MLIIFKNVKKVYIKKVLSGINEYVPIIFDE
jgi:hypothetical protein